VGEREGLVARIRHIRRNAEAPDERAKPGTGGLDSGLLGVLEARITHLEHLVEGLQDSVHRDAVRQGKRIAELEARIEPAALGRAMNKDARERGI
jgi:hypothetical protein